MSHYDDAVVAEAERTVAGAISAMLGAGPHQAVVGVAPAGAGKSYAIGTAVEAARRSRLRVVVATPTNEQAFALVADLGDRMKRETIVFAPASSVTLPDWAHRPNVALKAPKDTGRDPVVVGTLSKLGDAFARGGVRPFDLLLIDEAYQANAVHYYAVGELAPRHLLMGDSGQLAPCSTAPGADRWRGLPEDPLLTAVEVIRENHPSTPVYRLPITRRLDPRAVPVARAFYPDHPFSAAVLPGVRELRLEPAAGKRAHRLHDRVLEHAAEAGWAHVELPPSAAISADPESVALIVGLVRRLLERGPRVRCEKSPRLRRLHPAEIAVAVSHNDQKANVTLALAEAGLEEVVVNTANKLQGLTYEVVIAWHPLSGLAEVDEFHLDPGRLCVMLTRHRQACIVVGRAGDRELVEGIPPATPSYIGWDQTPALDGWYVHEGVFEALAAHRHDA